VDSTQVDQTFIIAYCEHGNETSSSIKGGKFVDQLSY